MASVRFPCSLQFEGDCFRAAISAELLHGLYDPEVTRVDLLGHRLFGFTCGSYDGRMRR